MTAPYLDTHKAIIGTSGAGKTVTAKDEVEALMRDRRHLGIIDPTGAWWGLRSNSAGDGPGFDIPIFGGDHGDVQIEPDQGDAVGNIIAGGVSAIVDVSNMDGRDQRRFVLGLMRALRRKPKGNFHLVVDEADEFAPQTAPDDFGFQLAEQMAWVAKRGRLAGFVLTAITQRPADITKAVLSQVQTIIAHQLIAPQDQKAIDDYLKANGDAATRKTVMSSLAGLARGERWIYSPRLGLLERGVTPMPSTFDSSRTPEPGETPVEPKMLAQIDIGAIRKALAPKAEESPSKLPETDNSGEILKLQERIRRVEADNQALEQDRDFWKERAGVRLAIIERARGALQEQGDEAPVEVVISSYPPVPVPRATLDPLPKAKAPVMPSIPASADGTLTNSAKKMLAVVIKMFPRAFSLNHIAKMADVSTSSSQWRANRQSLFDSGFVNDMGDGLVRLSERGQREHGVEMKPDSPDAARAFWLTSFPPATAAMLQVLIDAGGDWLHRDDIADRAGVSRTSSGLPSGLRELRDHQLIISKGQEHRVVGELL